ncbi:MAG: RDD family protein [Planctomycetota bacterium]|jgi:uncharacterized RDD family membrane protein YckC
MEVGLRALALIIDLPICFFSIPLVLSGTGWIVEKSGSWALLFVPFWFALLIAWPFLYFGLTTGLWGKTPGKFICRLEVVYAGKRPGILRALGRETLKLLAIGTGIGALLCAFQITYQGTTWYDQICRTVVQIRPYVRQTGTQKKFRQYMKEQEKLKSGD